MVLNATSNSLNGIIDEEIEKAEMMGYDVDDIDPELMGGLIANIAKRIRDAREKRKAGGEPSTGLSITTGSGTMAINDQGFSLLKPSQGGGTIQQGGIMDQIKDNPLLLAIPAGILALVLLKGR